MPIKYTSYGCKFKCGFIHKDNRNKELFLCLKSGINYKGD